MNKNPQKITQMFDEISSYYDRMNNLISFGSHFLLKKISIKFLKIKPNSYILDLCCGTGDFTKIISSISPKSKIIGIDNSVKMLKLAKAKNPQNVFMLSDCTNLPFRDNEFDYITIGFGLRNIQNRQKAICEIYRILKPNGKFLHLDFGEHNFVYKLFSKIVVLVVKSLNIKSDSYEYLVESIKDYPLPKEIINEFEMQGFKLLEQKRFLFGIVCAQILKK